MGLNYSGGMIVGASGQEIGVPDSWEGSLLEWVDDNDMDHMSKCIGADDASTYYGFMVSDVQVKHIRGEWLDDVEAKSKKFKKLTGVEADLIGSQDIYNIG